MNHGEAQLRGRGDRMLTGTWPADVDARAPHIDHPHKARYDPWQDHCNVFGDEALSRAEWDAAVRALVERWTAVVRGEVSTPDPVLEERVSRLRLDRRHWSERRSPKPVPRPMVDAELAQIATDWLPELGDDPGRVLGPWAEGLRRAVPVHRRALLGALAAALFVPREDGLSAFQRFHRVGQNRAAVEARAAARSVGHTPFVPWRVDAVGPEGLRLVDLADIAEPWCADGWVAVPSLGSVVERPAQPGDVVAARVCRSIGGWTARCALLLPQPPPRERVLAWIRFLGYRMRPVELRMTRETMLSRHGHVVVRWAHEWAWRQAC